MSIFDRIGEGLRAISNHPHRTAAVIVAGGKGSRMGCDTTKQFLELCGKPMIAYSLLAFEASDFIDEIVLVVREDEKDRYPALLEKYGIEKLKAIVSGGETRQESVWKGFSAISDNCDFVAIHDGARPLITPEQIRKVMLAGFDSRAASAAAPCKDTAKTVNLSAYVEQTIDRSKLWLVQTPQVFYANLYRAAAVTAEKDNFKATDDCSLAEHAGFAVRLVNTGYDNLKVTTPEDLWFAEAILSHRNEIKIEGV